MLTSCIKTPKTVENVWPAEIERYWVGPQFLSIPQMDWKLDSGSLVCVNSGTNKGVVLLTKSIDHPLEGFEISFEGGFSGTRHNSTDKIGLLVGLKQPVHDSDDLSRGHFMGVTAGGQVKLLNKVSKTNVSLVNNQRLIFSIEGIALENGKLQLSLKVRSEKEDNQLDEEIVEIAPETVQGLVSFFVASKRVISGESAWFESLEITGEGVSTHPENAKGPILNIENTFQNDTLSMTVFLTPLLRDSSNRVVLQTRGEGEWTTIAKLPIPDNNVVTFTLDKRNGLFQSYRVYTHYIDCYGSIKYSYVTGEIDKEN
ncbi:MAG: hypothetical protein DRJ09_00505 [Bacteroidetes bacterium]|nr:MAG: hypothetical protein DRJ09_00505 [Bacteroidota bacterium]